jgi:hypothetical protein
MNFGNALIPWLVNQFGIQSSAQAVASRPRIPKSKLSIVAPPNEHDRRRSVADDDIT